MIRSIAKNLEDVRNLMACNKKVLNVEEACMLTGLSKSHLYKLTASRQVPHYKPHGKLIYFLRTELEQWMLSVPIRPDADITVDAIKHLNKNKIR